jgi:hypothetical protein
MNQGTAKMEGLRGEGYRQLPRAFRGLRLFTVVAKYMSAQGWGTLDRMYGIHYIVKRHCGTGLCARFDELIKTRMNQRERPLKRRANKNIIEKKFHLIKIDMLWIFLTFNLSFKLKIQYIYVLPTVILCWFILI